MIDKTLEIKSFIKKNYSPGNIIESPKELQLNTDDILLMLFEVFPNGCIDDYELFNILKELGYVPQKRSTSEFCWCLIEN